MDGTNTDFLRHITGKRVLRKVDGRWVTPRVEVVQEAAGNQLVMTYIGRQQGTVAQWVELWQIFEVCSGDNGYEGGGLSRDAWWFQEVKEIQLRTTLDKYRGK